MVRKCEKAPCQNPNSRTLCVGAPCTVKMRKNDRAQSVRMLYMVGPIGIEMRKIHVEIMINRSDKMRKRAMIMRES